VWGRGREGGGWERRRERGIVRYPLAVCSSGDAQKDRRGGAGGGEAEKERRNGRIPSLVGGRAKYGRKKIKRGKKVPWLWCRQWGFCQDRPKNLQGLPACENHERIRSAKKKKKCWL